jgi:hypothetical protein
MVVSHPPIARKRWSDGTDGNEMGVVIEYEIDISDLFDIEPAPVTSRTRTSKMDDLRLADLVARTVAKGKP